MLLLFVYPCLPPDSQSTSLNPASQISRTPLFTHPFDRRRRRISFVVCVHSSLVFGWYYRTSLLPLFVSIPSETGIVKLRQLHNRPLNINSRPRTKDKGSDVRFSSRRFRPSKEHHAVDRLSAGTTTLKIILSGTRSGRKDNVWGHIGEIKIAGISGWTNDPPADNCLSEAIPELC